MLPDPRPNVSRVEVTFVFSPFHLPGFVCPTLFAPSLMPKGGISPLQPGDGRHSRFQGSTSDSPGARRSQRQMVKELDRIFQKLISYSQKLKVCKVCQLERM